MRVARLVYVAHGLRGSLYASLALARRLKDDGHEITFMAFRDIGADVTAAGFDLVPLTDGPDAAAEFRTAVAARGPVRAIPSGIRLRSGLVGSTEVRDRVQDLAPDALIIDAEMHAAILATRALRLPTVLAIPWFSPFRTSGLPPMHTDLGPPTSRLDHLRIEAAWEWQHLRRFGNRYAGGLSPRGLRQRTMPFQLNTPNIRNIRAVARFHRVDLQAISSWRHWIDPLTYPGLPLMSFTAQEMDFPHATPDTLTSVGAVIDEDRAEPLVSEETHARWRSFRDRTAGDGRPLIYASMGSMHTSNTDFYRRLVSVFARRQQWALVMGLGAQADVSALGQIPDNVLALDYAPQLDVLSQASAAIHHSGIGTVNECVWFEVPSIASSSGFVDQPGTAARVAHHGLGVSIDEADLTAHEIDGVIDRLLQNQSIRENLARMRAILGSYEQRRVAERLIASQLAG